MVIVNRLSIQVPGYIITNKGFGPINEPESITDANLFAKRIEAGYLNTNRAESMNSSNQYFVMIDPQSVRR